MKNIIFFVPDVIVPIHLPKLDSDRSLISWDLFSQAIMSTFASKRA